jgi:hypothetical protein
MPICQPSGSEMNQNVRISREKDLYFFNGHGSSIHESWQQHSIIMAAAFMNHGSSIHESWQQHS